MRIQLPVKVDNIIKTLEAAGYEAFAVGGCIRDSVLGRTPQDWDITTSAKPQDVKRLFSHTIDTGIQHGTVTVMLEHEGFEVTTYRIDGEYEDARHPKEVTYTVNLLEDLKRRDFTINAMAYNESRGLVDAFDGMGDLQKKVIRCVGIQKSVLRRMHCGCFGHCGLRHSLVLKWKNRPLRRSGNWHRRLKRSVQRGYRQNWSNC